MSASAAIQADQIKRSLTWEKYVNRFYSTTHELSLLYLWMLYPWHEPMARKVLKLPTEIVTTILGQIILVTLEEVKDKIVYLWIIGR